MEIEEKTATSVEVGMNSYFFRKLSLWRAIYWEARLNGYFLKLPKKISAVLECCANLGSRARGSGIEEPTRAP